MPQSIATFGCKWRNHPHPHHTRAIVDLTQQIKTDAQTAAATAAYNQAGDGSQVPTSSKSTTIHAPMMMAIRVSIRCAHYDPHATLGLTIYSTPEVWAAAELAAINFDADCDIPFTSFRVHPMSPASLPSTSPLHQWHSEQMERDDVSLQCSTLNQLVKYFHVE